MGTLFYFTWKSSSSESLQYNYKLNRLLGTRARSMTYGLSGLLARTKTKETQLSTRLEFSSEKDARGDFQIGRVISHSRVFHPPATLQELRTIKPARSQLRVHFHVCSAGPRPPVTLHPAVSEQSRASSLVSPYHKCTFRVSHHVSHSSST